MHYIDTEYEAYSRIAQVCPNLIEISGKVINNEDCELWEH